MVKWVGCPPSRLGVKRVSSKKCKRWAACSATPNGREKQVLLGASGTVVPLLTSVASAPWRPSHGSASTLHTKSFRQLGLEGAHHHCCGKCNTGPGAADTKCYSSVVRSMLRHFASCFGGGLVDGGGFGVLLQWSAVIPVVPWADPSFYETLLLKLCRQLLPFVLGATLDNQVVFVVAELVK